MKNLSRVIFVFVLLLLVTSIAAAAGPVLESFSTTGYTTNLVDIPGFPFPVPSEFGFLPSGHTKFHISAQGGPGVDGVDACIPIYGKSCADVCDELGEDPLNPSPGYPLCGVTEKIKFDDDPPTVTSGGTFTFEEWGIADQTQAGVNHGEMTVTTVSGEAEILFSGQASPAGVVQGSFKVNKGKDAYKHMDGGTYSGNAGYVFTVDYTPCGGKDGPDCEFYQCAVYGDEKLKVKKDKIEWKIENEGEDDLTISSITLNWPAANEQLEKVKLDGKTLYEQSPPDVSGPVDLNGDNIFLYGGTITGDWVVKPKDLRIDSGKKKKLTFEFETKFDDAVSSNYTILVKFTHGESDETCAVTFVDFP